MIVFATIRGGEGWLIAGDVILITGAQLRAARALALCDQPDLAARSGVSLQTIQRFERFRGRPIAARVGTLLKLINALSKMGVEFLNSDSPGVRLAAKRRKQIRPNASQ